MSKYLFSILLWTLCALTISCGSQVKPTPSPTEPVTSKLVFTPLIIEYGTIEQGSDPLRKTQYKNTGTKPINIRTAMGSCGCVVPSFDKAPIQPGAEGVFEIRYDTQRGGAFSKTVTITTDENGNMQHTITIKGFVKEKPNTEPVPANRKN
jgi:Protein of unknown function (DUF1573)